MSRIELTASEIMTPEVISVGDRDTVPEAVQLLLDAGISGAPVVDQWGNAVGVFSLAHAAMSRAQSDASEENAAEARADEWFYRLDLIRKLPVPLPNPEPALEAKRVGDVMSPRVHSIRGDCPIAEVTSYLLDRAIHRVFVRDEENKLLGIITSMDLLRVLGDLLDEERAVPAE